MCGIAGVAYADPDHPLAPELLRRMTAVLRHRGPDADGFYVGRGVGLGHRRLSIIDVAGGDQPIYGEDRRAVVVLNGEIYNFRDLRAELLARGHAFTTRTDTEVIVHAYEEWGPACVERLAGMFAFAVWDDARRRLLLARDRLGKKPLYYHAREGDRLLFASELKGLLQDSSLKRAPDLVALADYFAFGVVAGPRAAIAGVAQVPPGHYLVWEAGRARLVQYWEVPLPEPAPRAEGATLAAFDEAFCRAVEARLVSDVPLGAFLSGGVDSSAVVEAMARLSGRPVITTAVGFAEARYSELPYARLVAQALGTEHREVIVEPRAAEVLPRLAWHLDEPFADSSALPTWYLARAARERVTVALSGDGGDEVFAGYQRRYGLNRWERRLRAWLPRPLRAAVVAPLGRRYPKADWLPRPLRARYVLQNLAVDFERAYYNDLCLFRDDERAWLLAPDFQRAVGDHDPFEAVAPHFARTRGRDPLARLLYVDLKTWLPNDILVKVDRMTMANALEVRSPFLDHRLVEFAATVPSDVKYRGRVSKYLVKRHLEGRVPAAAIHRPKQGFELPVSAWLRGPLRELAEELVLSPRALERGYVRAAAVRDLWRRHQARVGDHGSQLWALMMLELWHRQFIDDVPGDGGRL